MRLLDPCTRCGHPGSEHGRESDLILGVVGSKRELCLECPGYVFDTTPSKPWLYAPKPAECGKCQADGTVNLVRINLSPGDGWWCLRCGWNVYDPAQDAALPVDDQRAITKADGPTR